MCGGISWYLNCSMKKINKQINSAFFYYIKFFFAMVAFRLTPSAAWIKGSTKSG